MMLTGDAGREPLPLFRAAFDGLVASKPSNQGTGEELRNLGSGDSSGAIKVLLDLDEMIRQEFG